MKKLTVLITLLLISIFSTFESLAQYNIPSKMNWWYEARFGMFIHFGSYSYLGHGEWAFSIENWNKSNYQSQVSANFNPTNFNAGTIVRLAKNAGMKYIVITAKHHEGFCMWQTAVQSFKDVTGTKLYDLPDFTNFKSRDILQELKDSCDAHGIKFCLYYSILDWNHPSQKYYSSNGNIFSTMADTIAWANYILDMKAQLKELITKYHPAIMWFDGDWCANLFPPTLNDWWNSNDGQDLYNYLLGLDSALIINERVKRGFGLGDFDNPENTVPAAPLKRQWETCRTMNNSWGYDSRDSSYKTPSNLIREMVRTVSRDGNYLLNIGPKGDGTVPEQSASRLNSFGKWMNINSESVYGTTRSPYKTEPGWGVFTKKESKLFVHVFSWPADGLLRIPSLTNTINKIYLKTDKAALLNYTDSSGCITISLPANAPDSINSVVVVDVSGVPASSTQYIKVTRITVKSVTGLKLVGIGDTLRMSAAITPANAAIKKVTWSVSDTSIALITSDGLVTGKRKGNVSIQANADDGTDIQGKLQISVTGQTGLDNHTNSLPLKSVLEQNYPNPFNPSTSIKYAIGHRQYANGNRENTTLKVYDILGNEIATLVNEEKPAGEYEVEFSAVGLASGVYFYTLRTGNFTQTKKFVLLR